jgi:coproporphyrinogen III oxidase-like Fe-S oxidoreductase
MPTPGPLPARLSQPLALAEEQVRSALLPTLAAVPAFRRPPGAYTFDVKYYGGERVELDAVLAAAAADVAAAEAISLYLHFPLCPYVCRFCHYHVRASAGRDEERSVLLADLDRCARLAVEQLPGASSRRVSSIYLGGGTPSLLTADELSGLLQRIRSVFSCADVEEITVETTPDSCSREWLAKVAALGVRRVSSGVQVLDDGVLSFMGRRHTTADAQRFLRDCSTLPDLSANVDLIAGLPQVGDAVWMRTLDQLVEQAPASITIYRLRLGRSDERPSGLLHLFEKNPELFPSQERVAVHMLAARGMLMASGYQEGPLGWFWRGTGQPKCYRDRWLLQRPLLGLGESAYSYGSNWQIVNAKSTAFKAALGGPRWPAAVATLLTPAEAGLRQLAWRLRASGEIAPTSEAPRPELQAAIGRLAELGLAQPAAGGSHRLTTIGTLLIDEIIRCIFHLRSWDVAPAEAG